MSDEVAQPIAAVRDMRARWALPTALRGGTEAMRKASTTYLPKEPGESDAAYISRRNRSFLFAAYDDTVGHLASKPFSRSVKLGDDTPEFMRAWESDVDLEGTSLTTFARAALDEAIDRGVAYALVDFPATGGALSRAAEKAAGLRPFFVPIPGTSILGWRSKRWNGREVLTHLRYVETAVVPDGEFGEAMRERVRVFDRDLPGERRDAAARRLRNDQGETRWRLFEKDADGAWGEIDSGVVSVNEIPLRAFYTRRTAFLCGAPALESLAWKNLEHWQSSSDQKHILHVARVPILFGSGIQGDEFKDTDGKPLELGPNRILTAQDPQARLGFVEHTGAAIEAGRTDIRDIEDQMVALGMKPLLSKPGDPTATGEAIDHAEATSDLKAWVRDLESFLASLFDLGALWIRETPGASVDVFDDFTVNLRGDTEIAALQKDVAEGRLSRLAYRRELVRRGVLAESFDAASDDEQMTRERAAAPPAPDPQPQPAMQ